MSETAPGCLDDVFTAAVARLLAAHPDDEQRRMLRSPGVVAGGRFYGFVTAADLTVKLPADRVRDLVADGRGRGGARPRREACHVEPRTGTDR